MIDNMLEEKIDSNLGHLTHEGLTFDFAKTKMKRTKFFKAFRHTLKKERLTQQRFTSYMKVLCTTHGMQVTEPETTVDTDLHDWTTRRKQTKQTLHKNKAQQILDAPTITQSEYKKATQAEQSGKLTKETITAGEAKPCDVFILVARLDLINMLIQML